jgi:hypothetical protein
MIVLEYRAPHPDLIHREVMIHFRVGDVTVLEWSWMPLLPFALFSLPIIRALPIMRRARIDLWENSGDVLLRQVDDNVRIFNTLTEETATIEYHALLQAWEAFAQHAQDQVLNQHPEAQHRADWRWLTEPLSPAQMRAVSAEHWFQGYEHAF